jgi:hypothetical protein
MARHERQTPDHDAGIAAQLGCRIGHVERGHAQRVFADGLAMRKLALTDRIDAARLRAVLSYDAATGSFRRRVTRGNQIAGTIAGSRNGRGRLYIGVDGQTYLAHRLAFLWTTGRWPTQIDHRNRDPLDNCWSNLREASQAENLRNQILRKTNTSGSVGVRALANGTYRATICVNYRILHLGTFKTFAAAVAARRAAQQRYGFSPGHGTRWRRRIRTPQQVQLCLYGQIGMP